MALPMRRVRKGLNRDEASRLLPSEEGGPDGPDCVDEQRPVQRHVARLATRLRSEEVTVAGRAVQHAVGLSVNRIVIRTDRVARTQSRALTHRNQSLPDWRMRCCVKTRVFKPIRFLKPGASLSRMGRPRTEAAYHDRGRAMPCRCLADRARLAANRRHREAYGAVISFLRMLAPLGAAQARIG